jgi:hypothetical protein
MWKVKELSGATFASEALGVLHAQEAESEDANEDAHRQTYDAIGQREVGGFAGHHQIDHEANDRQKGSEEEGREGGGKTEVAERDTEQYAITPCLCHVVLRRHSLQFTPAAAIRLNARKLRRWQRVYRTGLNRRRFNKR